jgi:NTP pyrophosphatase (non-canonical NTP hydrolase)
MKTNPLIETDCTTKGETTMGVLEEIAAEVERASVKFPTWPTDPLHALAVLGEEFGELTKAMLQHTYEPHKGVTKQDIREEALQTAAMALRLAMSLDSYKYQRSEQHKQSSEATE